MKGKSGNTMPRGRGVGGNRSGMKGYGWILPGTYLMKDSLSLRLHIPGTPQRFLDRTTRKGGRYLPFLILNETKYITCFVFFSRTYNELWISLIIGSKEIKRDLSACHAITSGLRKMKCSC
jgi:hypothetical protein